ncbi:hypothetical protein [Lysinibacillus fusiformis]|uniref:hypothetical protein n=1 Tax=Lysinibacillus fusiformis TaxID=28031 RepID=UPI00187F1677|nr:hypothetical protein [Lysinibacillus fusiformis]MBD8523791.1 hypothetical protein [Lysinibacillus fusiformis]
MKDVLLMLVLALAGWVFIRIMLKEPILPWKEKKASNKPSNLGKTQKKKKKSPDEDNPLVEKEARKFQELFPNVVGFENHMLRSSNHEFAMFAEVEPVNYFLRDPEEQEVIDIAFETWLASINYPVRIYLQNRFVDLTEPIEEIQRTIGSSEDLNSEAREFGENMINDLQAWQRAQPRYETKRYLLFDYKVDVKELRINDDEDVEERIIDKAFNELNRRVQAARQQLRRGEMEVQLLSTDGIVEVVYYAFNRRKAMKNRYRDIERHEQLALYVTADQSAERVAAVRGEIDRYVQEEKQKEQEQQPSYGTV